MILLEKVLQIDTIHSEPTTATIFVQKVFLIVES